MFVGAAFAATFAGSGRQGSNGRSGFSRDPLCHRKLEVRTCRGGFHSDHLIIEDGGSGLKPLLQKSSFGRSGFRRDLCVIEDGGSGLQGWPSPGPFAASKTSSGLKPLLQKSSFGRSGFSRDLCVIEDGGSGLQGWPSPGPFAASKTGSGLKPLLQKPSFCRSGFSRDLGVVENQRLGVIEAAFHCDPCVIEGGRFGAKDPPTKTVFRRSGFRRDPCAIEDGGLGAKAIHFDRHPVR